MIRLLEGGMGEGGGGDRGGFYEGYVGRWLGVGDGLGG